MKKTLLATAIVGALGASAAAQAATVYDQDGTKLDVYGRIAMGIAGGGPEYNSDGNRINTDADFVDVYSRLGLRMSHEVSRDLTAFGRLEWRFDGDERTGPSGNGNTGFKEVRQSYLGLQSDQFGTFQGGNFDSFYNQFVSLPFYVYIDRGLEFAGHPKQSRGDSIGYYTPDLSGFTVFLQGKHYSDRGVEAAPGVTEEPGQGTEVAAQGGVRYAQGPVTLGLGFVDDIEEGGGNDEVLYGLIGSYDFTDQFSMRLGYETRDENADYTPSATGENGYDKVGLGGTFTTGPWAFTADYYNVDRDSEDTRHAWAAGSYYKVSSNFDVFVEVADGDSSFSSDESSVDDNIDALKEDVYWLTGARYHF